MVTTELRDLIDALAAGRISRRRFLQGASALGLSTALAGALAADPALAAAAARQEAPVGPAVDRLIFSSFNVDQAPLEIQNDKMDLYLFGLKTAGANELAGGAPGVRLIEAPATTFSLILNPAPAPRRRAQPLRDQGNPPGDAVPGRPRLHRQLDLPGARRADVLPRQPARLRRADRLRDGARRRHPLRPRVRPSRSSPSRCRRPAPRSTATPGPSTAARSCSRSSSASRTSGARVGDLIRAALEGVGFQVQPIYQPFGPATLAVYASDPITFQWHIYTEGWSRSSSDRYDFGAINQFYAPWLGNMPGWLEIGFWQYEQPDLDALGQRLYRGEFASREERDELYRQMTALGLDESVRVWLVTALQSLPGADGGRGPDRRHRRRPEVLLRPARGSIRGDSPEMRVGNLWVWTDRTTWNPVGGFGDVYSTDIYRNLVDAPIINHPFTGLPIPFRAGFEVETAGPDGTLAGARGRGAVGRGGQRLDAGRRRGDGDQQGHLRLQQVLPGALPPRPADHRRPT